MSLDWTAGFLEGEGSFFMNRSKGKKPRPTVKAMQVDPECLGRLQSLHGGSVCRDMRTRKNAGGHISQPQYEWRLSGKRAIDLMWRLHPLMSEKRRAQIIAVLEEIAQFDLEYGENPGARVENR